MKDFKEMGVLSKQGEKWSKIEVELERKHILVAKSIEESGNEKFLKKKIFEIQITYFLTNTFIFLLFLISTSLFFISVFLVALLNFSDFNHLF